MNMLRKFLIFLLPIIAVGYLTTGCNGGGGGGGGDATGKTILCVGDSITRGLGVSAPYPSVLAGITGANVINSGADGESSGGGAGRINSLLNRYQPDIVCIMYGANDLIRGNSPESAIGNIAAIVGAVKAFGAKPIVGQVTPVKDSHAQNASNVKALNSMLGSVGAPIAGTFGAVGDNLQADGLHPNDIGASGIAGAFADKI